MADRSTAQQRRTARREEKVEAIQAALQSKPLNLRKNPLSTLVSPATQQFYLFAYNALSCMGWLFVLGLFNGYVQHVGYQAALTSCYDAIGQYVQLLTITACLEIVHAAIGLTKTKVAASAVQCLVRLAVISLISRGLGDAAVQQHWSFPLMVLTWSLSEMVRYAYYAMNVTQLGAPYELLWLRYSLFLVIYPIGAFAEAMQFYQGLDTIQRDYGLNAYYLAAVLIACYPIGLPLMYKYMLGQRKRYLRTA